MTPRIITADEAKALLDGAKLPSLETAIGRVFGDFASIEHFVRIPEEDFSIAADVCGPDAMPSEGAARLLAAAPDLAATVIAQAADIERLRSIIDGRTTAPSDAEITAHGTAAGRWRWASPDQHGEFPSTARWRASVAVVARVPGVRWWATDSDKRPCAWPVVAEASR